MNKRNGFTLVEMLAVTILLVVIMSIAFPSIVGSINRNRESQWELTLKVMYAAADIYVEDRRNSIPELSIVGSEIKIPLIYLIQSGLLEEVIVDTRDDSKVDIYSEILLTIGENKLFNYSYPAECSSCITIEEPK